MIGHLKGEILLKEDASLIVDVNGVGYRVLVSGEGLKKAEIGAAIEVFTWLYLRRETIDIYGCFTLHEFELFRFLEKMPGIGPKTALSLSGFGSIEKLKDAIQKQDTDFNIRVKGIGKKKIQRVLLELTGQIKKVKKQHNSQTEEALGALISLGFSSNEAKRALSEISNGIKEPKQRVAAALKLLGR